MNDGGTHMNERWKHMNWEAHTRRPRAQGIRRTDVYGFERYEDDRRSWYILSGEDEAQRHATHDTSKEQQCTKALLDKILSS